MTTRSKSILIVLGLANFLLLCCLIPGAIILLSTPNEDILLPIRGILTIGLPPSEFAASITPTPPPENGWKLYAVPADSFAIALPSSWKQLPLDQLTVSVDLDAVRRQNPEFANPLGDQNSSAALVKFIGVETALEGGVGNFSTNINVLHRTQAIEMPLDIYIPISLKALQDLPYAGQPILHRRVQTLAGAAEEFRYFNTLRLINGQTIKKSENHPRTTYTKRGMRNSKMPSKHPSAMG